jgi:uncharacterized protein (UPF0335 family)
MVEETQGVQTEQTDVAKSDLELMVNADSETATDSQSEKTEGQETEGKPAEGEKTVTDESTDDEGKVEAKETQEVEDEFKEGQQIPYERFSQINTQRKDAIERAEKLEQDIENIKASLNKPDIVEALMKSQGYTEDAIQQELTNRGFDVKPKTSEDEMLKQFANGLDLQTTDGWMKLQWRMAKAAAENSVKPVQSKLTEQERETALNRQEDSARKLAKEVYNIEFGQIGVDERNPNTAVGKMAKYLADNPDHASFGYVPVLKLAMAEESVQRGVEQGKKAEKDRQEKLKNSAMEGDVQKTSEGGPPPPNASVTEMLAWARKNPTAIDDHFNNET